jgi:hypothetical protein
LCSAAPNCWWKCWAPKGWAGRARPIRQEAREATRALLHSKAFSIYGGSYEIQNNITAKRSLALPDR